MLSAQQLLRYSRQYIINGIGAEGQKKILTFNLSNRTEVLLKSVIKFGIGDGLKVTGINSSRRSGKATFTHARVIA